MKVTFKSIPLNILLVRAIFEIPLNILLVKAILVIVPLNILLVQVTFEFILLNIHLVRAICVILLNILLVKAILEIVPLNIFLMKASRCRPWLMRFWRTTQTCFSARPRRCQWLRPA